MPEANGVEGYVTKEKAEHRPVETSPDGRYTRFDVVLGRGAFKTVYKAFDEREGIEVAWNQVIRSEPVSTKEEYDTLLHEINVLKKLKHKNIMTFYDSWVDKRKLAVNFITELFTSGTLRQYRQKHKKISESVLKRWAWQILQGLVYLHGHDPPIIHRDLKCDNIFVNGSSGVVKIGDLGLATLVRYTTQPQSVLGTPEFMAPELYDEKYDEKVDVYSFGMCMLELSTLQYPYSECANPAQIWKRVSRGIYPEGLKKVQDADLRLFIQTCITHSSSERPEARKLLKHSFFDSFRAEKEAESQRDGDSGLPGTAHRDLDRPSGPPSHVTSGPASTPPGSAGASSSSSSLSDDESSSSQSSHTAEQPGVRPPPESRDVHTAHVSSAMHNQPPRQGGGGDVSAAPSREKSMDDSRGSQATRVISDVRVVCKELDSDQGIALFELSILQNDGNNYTYEFDYNLDVDDTQTIMSEMQSDLHLSSVAAAHVAQHISRELDRVKSRVELINNDAANDANHSPASGQTLSATSSQTEGTLLGIDLGEMPLHEGATGSFTPHSQSTATGNHSHPALSLEAASTASSVSIPASKIALPGDNRQSHPRSQSHSHSHSHSDPAVGVQFQEPKASVPRPSPLSMTSQPQGQPMSLISEGLQPAGSGGLSDTPVMTPPAVSAFESAHGAGFANPGLSPKFPGWSNASRDVRRSAPPTSGLSGHILLPPTAPKDASSSQREGRSNVSAPGVSSMSTANGMAPPPPRPASSSDPHAIGPTGVPRSASARESDGGDNTKVGRNLSLSDVRRRFQQYEEDTLAGKNHS